MSRESSARQDVSGRAGGGQAGAALQALEQQLARAWVDGDRATIHGLLSPDWTVTDVTGCVRTKADVLSEMFAVSDRPIAAMTIDDVHVRLFGDLGIVTGRTHAVGSDGSAATLRFTDVAVQRGGRWSIVTSHGTLIQE